MSARAGADGSKELSVPYDVGLHGPADGAAVTPLAATSDAEFAELLASHRSAVFAHCYRMLGGLHDADDAVQDTWLRALRGRAGFEGRAALRTWLTRIATNVCLDRLAERRRRSLPPDDFPVGHVDGELSSLPREHWLEPVPERSVCPPEVDPSERAAQRQSVRLAFAAALQALPPRQRAALLLLDVLGWTAAEIGAALECSIASVNSLVQRARASLERAHAAGDLSAVPLSQAEEGLLARFVEAFESFDVDRLAALLTSDVVMSMPPFTLWLQGPAAVSAWLRGRGAGCRGSRLVAVASPSGPAFAQYRPSKDGGHHAWSLAVVEPRAGLVGRMTYFLDVERLFPRFDLPLSLPPSPETGLPAPVEANIAAMSRGR